MDYYKRESMIEFMAEKKGLLYRLKHPAYHAAICAGLALGSFGALGFSFRQLPVETPAPIQRVDNINYALWKINDAIKLEIPLERSDQRLQAVHDSLWAERDRIFDMPQYPALVDNYKLQIKEVSDAQKREQTVDFIFLYATIALAGTSMHLAQSRLWKFRRERILEEKKSLRNVL